MIVGFSAFGAARCKKRTNISMWLSKKVKGAVQRDGSECSGVCPMRGSASSRSLLSTTSPLFTTLLFNTLHFTTLLLIFHTALHHTAAEQHTAPSSPCWAGKSWGGRGGGRCSSCSFQYCFFFVFLLACLSFMLFFKCVLDEHNLIKSKT